MVNYQGFILVDKNQQFAEGQILLIASSGWDFMVSYFLQGVNFDGIKFLNFPLNSPKTHVLDTPKFQSGPLGGSQNWPYLAFGPLVPGILKNGL